MMIGKISTLILVGFFFSACIKTAEQVHREKRLETVSDQMSDTQSLVADLVTQMKTMQEQLNKLNGKVEEIEHGQKKVDPESISKMNESLNLLNGQKESDAQKLNQIQAELKEQKAFLEKLLDNISAMESNKAKVSKKKSAKGTLENGLQLIKNDKFSEARNELETIIDHEDLTPGEKNKVLFGLGKAEYFTGNSEKALVYFSKIYTKFPKASIAPASLLFIGRSLDKLGKKDEAKQAFQKVIEDYKNSKEANEARKELK